MPFSQNITPSALLFLPEYLGVNSIFLRERERERERESTHRRIHAHDRITFSCQNSKCLYKKHLTPRPLQKRGSSEALRIQLTMGWLCLNLPFWGRQEEVVLCKLIYLLTYSLFVASLLPLPLGRAGVGSGSSNHTNL